MVRFGYDGSGFSGWARQPGARTVEGLLREGILAKHAAPDLAAAQLAVASRTDRGVSARGNALALVSPLAASSLLRRLNAISPELFFTAASTVPPEFRVRHAARRVYRYFEPQPPSDAPGNGRALSLFRGRIDVRSFGRGVGTGSPTWRELESVTRARHGDGSVIEVRAPSFVWGEVRKIVGALREVAAGRLPLAELQAALAGRRRLTLPMAEPEGLVLWDVEYALPWETAWPGPNRYQAAFLRRAEGTLQQRLYALASLNERGTLAEAGSRLRTAVGG